MADTHDTHGSLNVIFGLPVDEQALSNDLGLEVNKVDRSYEPAFQAEAIDREGEEAAIAIQKRARWNRSFDVSGKVIDEAKFLAVSEVTVGGVKFIVTGNKVGDAVREFVEGSCTMIARVKIT